MQGSWLDTAGSSSAPMVGSDATLIPGFPALPHDGTMGTRDKQSGRRGGEDGMPLKLFVVNLEVLVWLAKPGGLRDSPTCSSVKVKSDLFFQHAAAAAAGWLVIFVARNA